MLDPVRESGLFASLRRLLDTALEIAQVRLALLGTEIQIEKNRVFDGLVWSAVALLVLGVGVVLMCGFVILLFWEGYRLAAVGSMALLFLGGGAMLMHEARQRLRNPLGMFATSIAEMQRDRSGLSGSDRHEQ